MNKVDMEEDEKMQELQRNSNKAMLELAEYSLLRTELSNDDDEEFRQHLIASIAYFRKELEGESIH